MDPSALFHQMLILFSVILVAYGATKAKFLAQGANKTITDLLVNVTCPATMLYAVATSSRSLSNGDVLMIVVVAAAVHVALMGFAAVVVKLLRVPEKSAGVYRCMMVLANVTFLGFPVVRTLVGSDGVFIASIYSIVFNIVTFTYGITQMSSHPEDKKFSIRTLCTPGFLSAVLGLVLYLVNFPFPALLTDVLGSLDKITSPGSMVVIGCALAGLKLKEVFGNWKVYVASLIKLIVIPVLAYFLLKPLHLDEMIYCVVVVLTGLPSAINLTLLTSKYDGDVSSAASCVFVSTLMGVVTLPLLVNILF